MWGLVIIQLLVVVYLWSYLANRVDKLSAKGEL
ncbi:MAG: hypothetical protein K0R78_1097 [Pelosinus sp.]|jgi:hypothetical protein|nr:hypothetical protein [Pelosinus sp.]